MFSLKHFTGLLFGILVVSCAPLPPLEPLNPNSGPPNAVPVAGDEVLTPEEMKEAEKKKLEQIKANEEARKRREELEREKNERVAPIGPQGREPIKPKGKYPTAMPIPWKDGFVFNPWTNKSVDARGVPSGTLIRDPNDGDPTHKFRVP